MIQSGGLLRYATVEGMDARDIRIHNFPPGSNAAPSRDDLLVIRRNHKLAPCHSTRCAGYHSLLVRGPEHEAPRFAWSVLARGRGFEANKLQAA